MAAKTDLYTQTIESFWSSIPPLWHKIRHHIRVEAEENFDITVNQLHMLRRIHFGKDSASKLAVDKHISRAAISRAVDVLVNKGLITRTQNPDDRRYIKLALTDEGEVLLNTLFGNTEVWMVTRLQALETDELENIILALKSLKTAFE